MRWLRNTAAVFGGVMIALITGVVGMMAFFSDFGPNETWITRMALLLVAYAVGCGAVGFILPRAWLVATIATWGPLDMALGGFVSKLRSGHLSFEWFDFNALVVIPVAAVLFGYFGAWARRKQDRLDRSVPNAMRPFVLLAACAALAPATPGEPVSVQFTIRICEATEQMQFWFNDEAKEHWSTCRNPLAGVPVYAVADSGERSEGKTGEDGIAEVPPLRLAAGEKFRLSMACTTHRCLSLKQLSVDDFTKPGANLLYVETVRHPVGFKP